MKIRHIILVLTLALGLALVLVAAMLVQEELVRLDTAQRLQASNEVREHMLVASTALSRERTSTYVHLLTGDGAPPAPIGELREQVDLALVEARQDLTRGRSYLPNADRSLDVIRRAEQQIEVWRLVADEAGATQDGMSRRDAAAAWIASATELVRTLQSSRLSLLHNNRPVDPTLRSEANVRAHADVLHEAVAYNEAVGVGLISAAEADRSRLEAVMARNVGRMELAWQLIGGEISSSLTPDVRGTIAAAQQTYERTYDPLQVTVVNAAPNLTPENVLQAWQLTSETTLDSLTLMQAHLLESSRVRLEGLVAQAQRSAFLVTLLAVGGVVAAVLILLVVRRRVIQPLRQVSEAMVRLAANDLTTPAPRARRHDEVGQMTNALRTFKANAILRQRTQVELQRVHHDLQDTYDQLRRDLEAAATIQMAMLPPPAAVDSINHTGLYSPSSLVAGDTYNVIRRPGGGVGFFQIDVAGHGAAAALVSVAGQHTLSQAILTRRDDATLEDVLSEVNQEWPPDLPYFTTIFGEIDPTYPRARMVQAGHPCPLLIGANGQVRFLGESGFPIGMLPQATYDTLEFEFAAGDRLLIYSDGVIETENRLGEFYSEDRLLALVAEHAQRSTKDLLLTLQASLRSWRGIDNLTDDVSVLVIERNTSWGPTHAIH
ncbi:PP2C family protein-serine/threonine phosphatase [Devosia sp. RR2S18]|uniref:PP2C family protein-serine/threonine phosphatase n=1 Tax=Devosia rhizosphaerae TaxID=3049774 RepID=UPI002541A256|nr:SpoIIE family protein phosphatase [Devosia sp. RR2S18]WIJ23778.1 SpoIIE family protein phosphatase [Devosia sp. RR2S18]